MLLKRKDDFWMGNEGFTLVEAMIAIFILVIGILSLYTMQLTSIKGNSTAKRITTASDWGSNKIEEFLGMKYSDAKLSDSSGDGLNGLNDATAATADHNEVSPDGVYSIYWNVADDQPMLYLKTIRVIVTRNDQGQVKAVTMNYIKAQYE